MATIDRILKWGSGEWQTLVLSCGHRQRVRRAVVKADQLMPGKRVGCSECDAATEAGYSRLASGWIGRKP